VIDPLFSSFNEHPEASAFVVENSVGYQIEYSPALGNETIQNPTCKTYGLERPINSVAVYICIAKFGSDLFAG
jgi:hypothetical protein